MASPSSFPRLRRDWVGSTSAHNWGGALPAVVRLLADRRADVYLPACPLVRAGERWEETSRGLCPIGRRWTTCCATSSVGLPSQGLARWLDEGSPDEVRPLALVRHVWMGDGSLPRYMAWRVQKGGDHLPSAWMERVAGTVFSWEGGRDRRPLATAPRGAGDARAGAARGGGAEADLASSVRASGAQAAASACRRVRARSAVPRRLGDRLVRRARARADFCCPGGQRRDRPLRAVPTQSYYGSLAHGPRRGPRMGCAAFLTPAEAGAVRGVLGGGLPAAAGGA